jgi:hypothetical protein
MWIGSSLLKSGVVLGRFGCWDLPRTRIYGISDAPHSRSISANHPSHSGLLHPSEMPLDTRFHAP